MNPSSTRARRISAAAATTMLLLGATTLSASARPDPGDVPATTVERSQHRCLLERVGAQYVRCDNLTGNGVPAPAWVREY